MPGAGENGVSDDVKAGGVEQQHVNAIGDHIAGGVVAVEVFARKTFMRRGLAVGTLASPRG